MRIIFLFLATMLSASLFSGCSGTPNDNAGSGLTPMPQGPVDPDNSAMVKAIQQFVAQQGAPAATSYNFSRIDLNGDGRREALVILKTPYGYWCGDYGCTMLVLKAHDEHFTLAGSIRPVRGPLYISDTQTRGWQDLIIRVSGRQDRAKDVLLRFDGRAYPNDPPALPAHDPFAFYRGRAVFK